MSDSPADNLFGEQGDAPAPTESSLPAALAPSAAQTLQRIRDILARSRSQALQAVNAAMVQAYWHVGREIALEEQRGSGRVGYGARLVETLAQTLTADFGRGFTPTNLWYMRQFYLTYPNLHALRGELSWTHYRLLLKVDRPEARAFYEVEAVQSYWSTRELERQINPLLFERFQTIRGTEWNLLMAGSVIVLIPLLVLFFVGQRYFIRGIVMSGLTD
jgi:uncharacterized protein DUF1016